MRNELAIILSDDFRPIQQQLNAKRELFCIFPILQKSFRGISRHSSTFWMIFLLQLYYHPSCKAKKVCLQVFNFQSSNMMICTINVLIACTICYTRLLSSLLLGHPLLYFYTMFCGNPFLFNCFDSISK